MRNYEFFNLRRVTLQDLNDVQSWLGQDIRNYIGVHLQKGIIRESDTQILGDSSFAFLKRPQEVIFDLSDVTGNTFGIPIVSAGVTGMYFINASGELFSIVGDEAWRAAPTDFQNSGNINIPLASGDGDYYIWIGRKNVYDSTYVKIDKMGVNHNPKVFETYEISVVFANPAQPPADVIYLGKITKATTTLTADYTGRLYAGIKSDNVNIKIESGDKPATYADGESKSLKEHINSVGSGTISPDNPHGTLAKDTLALSSTEYANTTKVMTNGIVSITDGNQQTYRGLSNYLGQLNNTVRPNHAVVVLNFDAVYRIIYQGKAYGFSDIQSSTGSYLYVDFNGDGAGSDDAEGWYQIVILKVNPTDDFLTIRKESVGSIAYAATSPNYILLGCCYWKNSGGVAELRQNPNKPFVNGQNLLQMAQLGAINEAFINHQLSNDYMPSIYNKNLIKNGNLKYPAVATSSTTYDIVWDTSELLTTSLAQDTGVFASNGRSWRLSNIATGSKFKIVIPSTLIDYYKIQDFVMSYTIRINSTDTGYVDVNMDSASSVGGVLTPPNEDSFKTYFVDFRQTSGNMTIEFILNGTWGGADAVYIDNVQILPNRNYQNTLLPSPMAQEVYYNTSISSNETRSVIKNISLDGILELLAINNQTIQYEGGAIAADFPNFATTADNLVIIPFRAKANKVANAGANPNHWAEYTFSFSYDSSLYEVVTYSIHQLNPMVTATNLYDADDSSGTRTKYLIGPYVASTSAGAINFKVDGIIPHIFTPSGADYGDFVNTLYFTGIVILKAK